MLELKPKTVLETRAEKEQQQKKLLTGKYRKGLKLFAMDPIKKRIYEVPIEKRKDFDVASNDEKANYKATIDKNHPMLWALNLKNAVRKFGFKYNKEYAS